jgi:UDP-N-acetylglucosamine 1-carboxyvinyltransferase
MSKFIIKGKNKLRGEVEIGGMKNAALPILVATILLKGRSVISNVPQILDVLKMIEILESLGAKVEWLEPNKLSILTDELSLKELDQKKVKSMRSSALLMGPLLSRFKEMSISEPGGCIIGARPLDTHLYALKALGAEIEFDNKTQIYSMKTNGLKGNYLVLPEISVTATENAILAAVKAEGRTIIKLAAAEPHVEDLVNFLNKAGAKIQGGGTHTLIIDGVKELHGVEHKVIPDQIEVGTFAVAAAALRGNIKIKNIIPEHCDIIFSLLRNIGVNLEVGEDFIDVTPGGALSAFKLKTLPYPGFPTDLQAPFGVLATQCNGTTLIHEPLYEGRLGYIKELVKMGANAVICDPHRVLISGPTPLYGQEIKSLDLRAGATLLIAAMVAEGESVLYDAEIIDRGYERIDEKFRKLGAEIERID